MTPKYLDEDVERHLETLTISEDITVKSNMFRNIGIETVILKNGKIKILDNGFSSLRKLKNIIIENANVIISDKGFFNCPILNNVVVSNGGSLEASKKSFIYCPNLKL